MRSALLTALVGVACTGASGGGTNDGPLPADAWIQGMAPCPDAMVDLGFDPQNCGWCGHDCAGVACDGGLCEPSIVAPTGNFVFHMASDDAALYWTNESGQVMTVAKTGGSPTVLASGLNNTAAPLTVDDVNVYWADTQAIMKVAKSGGASPQQLFHTTSGNTQLALALDQDYVYWFDGGNPGTGSANLRRVLKVGGQAQLLGSISGCPNNGNTSQTMVTHGGTLYFEACWMPAHLSSVPSAGGSIQLVADSFTAADKIVADDQFVYWPEMPTMIPGVSHVWKIPLAGGAKIEVTQATPQYGLQLFAGNLYWIDYAAILAVPITGGPRRTYVVSTLFIPDLAVDASWVFFVDGSYNQIYKVAR